MGTQHGKPLRLLSPLLAALMVLLSACEAKPIDSASLHKASDSPPLILSNQSGGAFTISNRNQGSLQAPQPKLSGEQQLAWAVGKSFATQAWVTSPSSTTARDGLGPLFNANSCTGCHVRNRQGELPEKGLGTILRFPAPSPLYGEQLQDMAVPGFKPEGQITWQTINSSHTDAQGNEYQLQRRQFSVDNTAVSTSARLAPALIGMGLLDNTSDEEILANSDPDDKNRDGISGRANIRSSTQDGTMRIGRFGWKASQSSLHEQIALAFHQDMGISSSLHLPENCIGDNCQAYSTANTDLEISDKLLSAVTDYIANLAVPAAAHDAQSQQGCKIFEQLACAACHTPRFQTKLPSIQLSRTDNAKKSNTATRHTETIYPFSDLLLHDMGAALADQNPTDETPANEWRTAPLWGLGIRARNPDNTRLLHDGRARSITEAILWHGGEAERSKIRFTQLSHQERTTLLYFLKAL